MPIATLVLLLISAAQAQGYLSGTVRSNDGKPLAGVLVWDSRRESTKTDSLGAFRIKKAEPVLFFSLDGYEPRAVVPAKDQAELAVTLENSVGKTWVIPNCEDARPSGLNLRYSIPKTAEIKIVTSDDYKKQFVRYPHGRKKQWLVIWTGGTVSFGHPIPEDFLDAASYQERSISFGEKIGGGGACPGRHEVRRTLALGWRSGEVR